MAFVSDLSWKKSPVRCHCLPCFVVVCVHSGYSLPPHQLSESRVHAQGSFIAALVLGPWEEPGAWSLVAQISCEDHRLCDLSVLFLFNGKSHKCWVEAWYWKLLTWTSSVTGGAIPLGWNNSVLCSAGSREGFYTGTEAAAVWRTLIVCLAGHKLCFCVPSPYLALPQMPGAGAPSAPPRSSLVLLPWVPTSQSLRCLRANTLYFHQFTPSMFPNSGAAALVS